MGKIILNRGSEWRNRARSYAILIDGAEVGKIANNTSEEFTVADGAHTIIAKISWCSSNVFDVTVKGNDIAYLRVKSGMKYFSVLYAILLIGIIATNFLKRQYGNTTWYLPVMLLMVGVPVLYVLYYLTIGRTKYLLIEDDKNNVFK
jgi:hypothetical protein